MPLQYIVQQGDCISSIAFENGFFPNTIWNAAENADLKNLRKDPNVLLAGDTVVIPDKQSKQEPGATEQRHCFKLKGVPARLHMRLLDADQKPRQVSYKINIDGKVSLGQTDADGRLKEAIPPDARTGLLMVVDQSGKVLDSYRLSLGHMDPVTTTLGQQLRLTSLGYDCGQLDGTASAAFADALRQFQSAANLNVTGQADDATMEELRKRYGC